VTRLHRIQTIQCTYPENWQLSEDQDQERLTSFTLQSPNTAFMSVYVSRQGGQTQQLIEEMTELLTAEYDEVESHAIDAKSLGLGNTGQDLQAVDLNFYFLDLLVTARLIAFSDAEKTVLVQCQAEDREFESLEMVYRAMLVSMFRKGNEKTSPDPG
jgi:hypothetical protein